jgi:hypothetical protein
MPGKRLQYVCLVALRVAVDAAQHRRPRPLQHEVPAAAQRDGGPGLVDDVRHDAGEREGGAARLGRGDPGQRVIMIMPVSVCHHVSTTGQRSPPMYFQYQAHASGLIGSPTLPSSRSELRSSSANSSWPYFMSARMAVGAVYRMVDR